jgi:hypothetical protein
MQTWGNPKEPVRSASKAAFGLGLRSQASIGRNETAAIGAEICSGAPYLGRYLVRRWPFRVRHCFLRGLALANGSDRPTLEEAS